MFARASAVFVAALPVLAAASAIPRTDSGPSNQCNTGAIQCCQETQSAAHPTGLLTGLLALLDVVIDDITALVGLTCSPITVIGAGGSSCTAQPVCCTNNSFHGLIALGCTPINIGL